MKKIILEDRVIYRASKGKKVKFVGNNSKFSEIVVDRETNRIVEVNK